VASMGLKAFSGVTVGIGGALVGVHWSLALSAMVLATVATSIFAMMIRSGGTGDNETVPETTKPK
jgi:hypothetical protein